jgi:hypothetical protein
MQTFEEEAMTTRAQGTFEVKPTARVMIDEAMQVGHTTLAKQFSGDLSGSSTVEMLSALTATEGSAGYVAIERVEGTLGGKRGRFLLQHSGTMNRGAQTLTLTVIPDSGKEGLVGLSGAMTIEIVEKQHHYVFEYAIAP